LVVIRKASPEFKRRGIFLYVLTLLQSIWVGLILGGISTKNDPSNPAADDDWPPQDRLFRMSFGIADITMAFIYFPIFYHMMKALNHFEVNPDRKTFFPSSKSSEWILKLTISIIVLIYLGLAGYLCYTYQSKNIRYSKFVFPIYLITLIYSLIIPSILTLYLHKFRNEIFERSELKQAYFVPYLGMMGWSFVRVYRSVHGLIERDLIFEMLGETQNGNLVYQGILFFIGNLLPYMLVNSLLIVKAYTAKQQSRWTNYKSMVRHNSDLTSSALNE
jgi:hypothetical protein